MQICSENRTAKLIVFQIVRIFRCPGHYFAGVYLVKITEGQFLNMGKQIILMSTATFAPCN